MIDIFDKNIKRLLGDLLKQSLESPVSRKKFRIENKDNIEYIDFLETNRILRTEESDQLNSTYVISDVILYLADNEISHNIFNNIDRICSVLRNEYEADVNDEVHVPVKTILDKLKLDIKDFLVCYKFLGRYALMGRTTDLTQEDAFVSPTESLNDFDNFLDLTKRMLKTRYPDSFNIETSNKKPHGNTEINANKREAVLGAAIAVLAEFPEQCRSSSSGKVMGARVAKLLEEKSPILFKQYDGEPPLSPDKITREINKWLKLLS